MKTDKNKKRILIVEDEKPLLMAIKSKLKSKGYDVLWAEDGEKGLEMVKEEKLDLILLDILLPKKNGFEVLEELNEDGSKIPIIIISNSGQPVEIERALKLGVKDYLIKADFSPDEVVGKVEKTIGKGFLPVSEKQDVPKEEEYTKKESDSKKSVASKGASVLVVEDDGFLRGVIAQKLNREGFIVQSAIDAGEAFKSITKNKPQIILLDLILPGIDGYEILDRLKKEDSTKDIPVVVLSNLGQREDVDRAMSAGAVDYLIKANFTPGEIIQKVRDILKES